ncbi:hypothetical protein LIER_24842 [Lithospermum erythrorhizon]|uniref:Uncharacterized protein n=1 Tax=Lithospermum erythrorhizon TaxID=34254 RepID=A0AAV3R3S4_LITER
MVIKNITDSNPTDWRSPITEYLANGQISSDTLEAKKLQNRNFKYQIDQRELYKKSWDGPLLTCVETEDVLKVLAKVHEGCDARQQMGNAPQLPTSALTSVVSSIPFVVWGVDLVGKLLRENRGAEFAIVAEVTLANG